MLLKYPQKGEKANTGTGYDSYKRRHRNYILAYKRLHTEVAAFSLLPEKFIQEVEPVIDEYLQKYTQNNATLRQRKQLELITNFISRFHEFMDEATEMFSEHQDLSDETFAYLKRMIGVDALHKNKPGSAKDYAKLGIELIHLNNSLRAVKASARATAKTLDDLAPAWQRIHKYITRPVH